MQDTKQSSSALFSDFKLSFWDLNKRKLFTQGDEGSFNKWFAQLKNEGVRSQVLPIGNSLRHESTANLDSFRIVSLYAPTEVPYSLVLIYLIIKSEKVKYYNLLLIERINGDTYQSFIEGDRLVIKSERRPITIAEWYIPTLIGF